MVKRSFWLKKVEALWKKRSIIWLSGVRRVGKTSLCKSLPKITYFDCELPRTRQQMEDPESFLENLKGRRIVLDEVHRLENPSELLKIAADHYPDIRVLATGSSTLGASSKFKDTLTGRKTELWLTPLSSNDLSDFQQSDLPHRLLRGGLPPFFLSPSLLEYEFQEWIDAYWAKDIQTLFRLEKRDSLQKFLELLIHQSGGLFEATTFARNCGVSRTTIANYLKVLEATFVVHIIRPFKSYRPTEILAMPKVYAFDTGFVCYYRGWDQLRREDLGLLWEHFVLNELQAHLQSKKIQYWRDKQQHEIDFILAERGAPPIAIECKWVCKEFKETNFRVFSALYPEASYFVVATDISQPFEKRYGNLPVHFMNLPTLIKHLLVSRTP